MIVVSQNFANIIIEALNYVVNFLGNPKYLQSNIKKNLLIDQ